MLFFRVWMENSSSDMAQSRLPHLTKSPTLSSNLEHLKSSPKCFSPLLETDAVESFLDPMEMDMGELSIPYYVVPKI